MKKTYALEIDTDRLPSVTDEYLAALWLQAQFLPVAYGDRDACEVVRAIGVEIIQRWMRSTPTPMFHIQSHDYWHELTCRFARWNGSEWVAKEVAQADSANEQTIGA